MAKIKRKSEGRGSPSVLEYGELATDGEDLFLGDQDKTVTIIKKNPVKSVVGTPSTLEKGELVTDGNKLFFGTDVGVKSADGNELEVFLNADTLSQDTTLPTNFNGMVAGPFTVPAGVTLIVPPGSRMVII